MSFAGVIVFELGYDGETVRQYEFEGLTFDQVVSAPAELADLRSWFARQAEDFRQSNIRLQEQVDRLREKLDEWEGHFCE